MGFDRFDWEKLLNRIAAGSCTPFIGAGACTDYLPSGSQLSEAIADEEDFPFPEGHRDLPKVAQYSAISHRDSAYPKHLLARFFSLTSPSAAPPTYRTPAGIFGAKKKSGRLAQLVDARKLPIFRDGTTVHSILAGLNSKLYLTTNYDDFMRHAIMAGGREALSDFCRWTPHLFNSFASPFDSGFVPTHTRPLVYHLHGTATVPASIVVTEDDYLDYTAYIAQDLARAKEGKGKKVMLPGYIRTAMTDNLLLFIGYGVRDENLRVVLRTLWQTLSPSSDQLNIAVQLTPEPGNSSADLEKMKEYLEKQYEISLRLHVYWGDAKEFVTELHHRLAAQPYLIPHD